MPGLGLAPRSELAACGQESMGGIGMWPLGGAVVGVADHSTAKLSGHSLEREGCFAGAVQGAGAGEEKSADPLGVGGA